MKKDVNFLIRLDRETERQLNALAEKKSTSKAAVVRELIRIYSESSLIHTEPKKPTPRPEPCPPQPTI